MEHEPIGDHAERKRILALIERIEKEQKMRCVDCEQHDYVVGTHYCNHKGKSGRRKPRRISEEDAYKDVPCEYVEWEGARDEQVEVHR